MRKYLKQKNRNKETRRKYIAISEAWGKRVKPLKKKGILTKIRWRK